MLSSTKSSSGDHSSISSDSFKNDTNQNTTNNNKFFDKMDKRNFEMDKQRDEQNIALKFFSPQQSKSNYNNITEKTSPHSIIEQEQKDDRPEDGPDLFSPKYPGSKSNISNSNSKRNSVSSNTSSYNKFVNANISSETRELDTSLSPSQSANSSRRSSFSSFVDSPYHSKLHSPQYSQSHTPTSTSTSNSPNMKPKSILSSPESKLRGVDRRRSQMVTLSGSQILGEDVLPSFDFRNTPIKGPPRRIVERRDAITVLPASVKDKYHVGANQTENQDNKQQGDDVIIYSERNVQKQEFLKNFKKLRDDAGSDDDDDDNDSEKDDHASPLQQKRSSISKSSLSSSPLSTTPYQAQSSQSTSLGQTTPSNSTLPPRSTSSTASDSSAITANLFGGERRNSNSGLRRPDTPIPAKDLSDSHVQQQPIQSPEPDANHINDIVKMSDDKENNDDMDFFTRSRNSLREVINKRNTSDSNEAFSDDKLSSLSFQQAAKGFASTPSFTRSLRRPSKDNINSSNPSSTSSKSSSSFKQYSMSPKLSTKSFAQRMEEKLRALQQSTFSDENDIFNRKQQFPSSSNDSTNDSSSSSSTSAFSPHRKSRRGSKGLTPSPSLEELNRISRPPSPIAQHLDDNTNIDSPSSSSTSNLDILSSPATMKESKLAQLQTRLHRLAMKKREQEYYDQDNQSSDDDDDNDILRPRKNKNIDNESDSEGDSDLEILNRSLGNEFESVEGIEMADNYVSVDNNYNNGNSKSDEDDSELKSGLVSRPNTAE